MSDCGTESARSFLQREIDDCKLLLPVTGENRHKELNLLVISHLHDDPVGWFSSKGVHRIYFIGSE